MHADWRDEAACLGLPVDLMVPDSQEGVARAKQVCARCPVSTACLAHAVNTGEVEGVWGGTSPDERRLLRHPAVDAGRSLS